jgi:hypothetical protein
VAGGGVWDREEGARVVLLSVVSERKRLLIQCILDSEPLEPFRLSALEGPGTGGLRTCDFGRLVTTGVNWFGFLAFFARPR